MMYDELDWEDIESRLYSQVYHGNAESEQLVAPSDLIIDTDTCSRAGKGFRYHSRYFHAQSEIGNRTVYIPLEDQNVTPSEDINDPVPSTPNSADGNGASQFQNNITVNQYTIPVIINSDLHEPSCRVDGKFFTSWAVTNENLLDKRHRKRQKRRTRNKEKGEKDKPADKPDTFSSLRVEVNVTGNVQRKVNDVVYVSDDSNSDCVMENMECRRADGCKSVYTGFPKKYNENDKYGKNPESDDDIIYIPPPPIEVIEVDVEEIEVQKQLVGEKLRKSEHTSQKSNELEIESQALLHATKSSISSTKLSSNKANCSAEHRELLCTPEPSGSNDFLDNGSDENNINKFNFGLHGSEFNSSQGDFIRPANPTEYCETESSCSTNDCHREISNSVKTVVFDEVEFPREDIFAEKNLESFGTYITPKRIANRKSKVTVVKSGVASVSRNLPCTSSDSSSETDDEQSEDENPRAVIESNKKLPTLSPMQFGNTSSKKKSLKEKSTVSHHSTPKNSTRPKTASSKRKSDVIEVFESDSDIDVEGLTDNRKKQPKKKHKMSTSIEEGQKKKKKSTTVLEDLSDSTTSEASSHKKKKKQQILGKGGLDSTRTPNKHNKTLIEGPEDEDALAVPDTSEKKKKKTCSNLKNSDTEAVSVEGSERRKKKNSSESRTFANENISEITSEATKKKKKKGTSVDAVPISSATTPSEKKKKKKTVSSDNSENEDSSVEKHQKKRKNSCSTWSNKSLGEGESEDEYIDVVGLDQTNEEVNTDTNNPSIELDGMKAIEKSTCHLKTNEDVAVNPPAKDTEDKRSSTLNAETATTQEAKSDHSDEEIIVDDDVNSTVSSLIVVDEVNSSTIIEGQSDIQVLLSSDSECDFADLDDVGKDLQLANCTASQSLIVVDATFGDNSATHTALEVDYSNFDVEAIQKTQSDDPEVWKISYKDRALYLNCKPKGPRCNRCRHYGHLALKCTEKVEGPKCSLCGIPGHLEPRCPNKMCRQCGNLGEYSTFCWKCFRFREMLCSLCNMTGHAAEVCPDLWRRYHLTTKEGPLVVAQNPQLKPRHQRWCSGCGRQGHLEHECNYIYRRYPSANPCIFSYEDVLSQGSSIAIPQDNTESSLPLFNAYNTEMVPYIQEEDTDSDVLSLTDSSSCSSDVIFVAHDPQSSSVVPTPRPRRKNASTPLKQAMPVCRSISLVSSSSSEDSASDEIEVAATDLPHASEQQKHIAGAIGVPGDETHPQVEENPRSLSPVVKNVIMAQRKLRRDRYNVTRLIMRKSDTSVCQFLKNEISELQSLDSKVDPTVLSAKFIKYKKYIGSKNPATEKVLRAKRYWFRLLNMFLFGLHECLAGRKHMQVLKKFLKQKRNNIPTRKSLLSSYSYIFGADLLPRVRYVHLINAVIKNRKSAKRKNVLTDNIERDDPTSACLSEKTSPLTVDLQSTVSTNNVIVPSQDNTSAAVLGPPNSAPPEDPHLESEPHSKLSSEMLAVCQNTADESNLDVPPSESASELNQTTLVQTDDAFGSNATQPYTESDFTSTDQTNSAQMTSFAIETPVIDNVTQDLGSRPRFSRITKELYNKYKFRAKRTIVDMIMKKPYTIVCQFLKKEMAQLQSLSSKLSPLFLKQQLMKHVMLKRNKHFPSQYEVLRKFQWLRIANMFIFGLHGCLRGGRHLGILKSYVDQNEKQLLVPQDVVNSYCYIFGNSGKVDASYLKLIDKIIKKTDDCQNNSESGARFKATDFSEDGCFLADIPQGDFYSFDAISSAPPTTSSQVLSLASTSYENPQFGTQASLPPQETLPCRNTLDPSINRENNSTTHQSENEAAPSEPPEQPDLIENEVIICSNPLSSPGQQQIQAQTVADATKERIQGENGSDNSLQGIRISVVLKRLIKKIYFKTTSTIMEGSEEIVCKFLEKEMAELYALPGKFDPVFLKQQLDKYNKLGSNRQSITEESLLERCQWFRTFNMFIFGLHECSVGGVHMQLLKDFLEVNANKRPTRNNLLISHSYIFGFDRHLHEKYYKLIDGILSSQTNVSASSPATVSSHCDSKDAFASVATDSPLGNSQPLEDPVEHSEAQPLEADPVEYSEAQPLEATGTVENFTPSGSTDVSHGSYSDPQSIESAKQVFVSNRNHIILNEPYTVVYNYLKKEMAELEAVRTKFSNAFLRRISFKYNKARLNQSYWFRILNMFIIGVHKFYSGKIHMEVLKKFLEQGADEGLSTRDSVVVSYDYIFGTHRHRFIDYTNSIIKISIRSSKVSSANVPLSSQCDDQDRFSSTEATQPQSMASIPTTSEDVQDRTLSIQNDSNVPPRSKGNNTPGDINHSLQNAVLLKKIVQHDQRINREVILEKPYNDVCAFLRRHISEMHSLVTKFDPEFLKHRAVWYQKLQGSNQPLTENAVREKCFWFRVLNMFVFGLHGRCEGKMHMKTLTDFLEQKATVTMSTRKKVLFSHSYIFRSQLHANVNYSRMINRIVGSVNRNDPAQQNTFASRSVPCALPPFPKAGYCSYIPESRSENIDSSKQSNACLIGASYGGFEGQTMPMTEKIQNEACAVSDSNSSLPQPSEHTLVGSAERATSNSSTSGSLQSVLATDRATMEGQAIIRRVILNESHSFVREFLKNEMIEMLSLPNKFDTTFLKQQLVKYVQLKKGKRRMMTRGILHERFSWVRVLNMFIFGLYECGKGRMHMKLLTCFLKSKQNGNISRRSLLVSYTYIFGTNKHTVDYKSFMDYIIRNFGDIESTATNTSGNDLDCSSGVNPATERDSSTLQVISFPSASGSCQQEPGSSYPNIQSSSNEPTLGIQGFPDSDPQTSGTPQSQATSTGLLISPLPFKSSDQSIIADGASSTAPNSSFPSEQQNQVHSSVDETTSTQINETSRTHDSADARASNRDKRKGKFKRKDKRKKERSIGTPKIDSTPDVSQVTIMTKRIIRPERKKIARAIRKNTTAEVCEFLEKEMAELRTINVKFDALFLKQQLVKYIVFREGLMTNEESLREKTRWCRILNMFIFGVNGFGEGKMHMDVLRNFLEQREGQTPSRRDVLKAHGYIFGSIEHPLVSYYNVMDEIIKKTKEK